MSEKTGSGSTRWENNQSSLLSISVSRMCVFMTRARLLTPVLTPDCSGDIY